MCARRVRLRDMAAHAAVHAIERRARRAPTPCRNALCGRTAAAGAELGLCARCYGPLYVAAHDPDGRALRRRVERRLITQVVAGCGNAWCRSARCRDRAGPAWGSRRCRRA